MYARNYFMEYEEIHRMFYALLRSCFGNSSAKFLETFSLKYVITYEYYLLINDIY